MPRGVAAGIGPHIRHDQLVAARRVEAIRHLNSMSHWTLLHMAVELRYGTSAFAGSEPGILADQMAASLLNLTGQNFQTTRDHIAYLISLSLLERQPGKSLRVALSEQAATEFHQALGVAAARPYRRWPRHLAAAYA